MTEKAGIYGTVLFELQIPLSMGQEAARLMRENPALQEALTSPAVPKKNKYAVIERVFREPDFSSLMVRFLKKACDAGCIGQMEDISETAGNCALKAQGIMKAELHYVTMPDEAQIAGMKRFLCRNHGKKEVVLALVEEKALLGGFVLKAGDIEYDYSLRGRIGRLSQAVAG